VPSAQKTSPDEPASDNGDFCGFLQASGTLFVGTPSNASICHGLLNLSEADVRSATRITRVKRRAVAGGRGSWIVESERGEIEEFEAVIFAGHDPSLPGAGAPAPAALVLLILRGGGGG